MKKKRGSQRAAELTLRLLPCAEIAADLPQKLVRPEKGPQCQGDSGEQTQVREIRGEEADRSGKLPSLWTDGEQRKQSSSVDGKTGSEAGPVEMKPMCQSVLAADCNSSDKTDVP